MRASILLALLVGGRVFAADAYRVRADSQYPRYPNTVGRILEWGSRPWELRSNPLIMNQVDGCEHPGCAAYFILDAADLRPETLRLPRTARELAFVAALENRLHEDGPSPWPILVFSAPDRRATDPGFATLATTRRIVLCEQKEVCRPAAAILLNSLYWGGAESPPSWVDRCLAALAARHELHHARRVWLHAQKTTGLADAIEARLRESGISRTDRNGLESMVSRSIAATEEIEAIEGSLGSTVLLPAQRMGVQRYQEDNRIELAKTLKRLVDLFTADNRPGARQELGRWLESLFRNVSPEIRKD